MSISIRIHVLNSIDNSWRVYQVTLKENDLNKFLHILFPKNDFLAIP